MGKAASSGTRLRAGSSRGGKGFGIPKAGARAAAASRPLQQGVGVAFDARSALGGNQSGFTGSVGDRADGGADGLEGETAEQGAAMTPDAALSSFSPAARGQAEASGPSPPGASLGTAEGGSSGGRPGDGSAPYDEGAGRTGTSCREGTKDLAGCGCRKVRVRCSAQGKGVIAGR